MTKEELQLLGQKIKEGTASEAEKLAFVQELHITLSETSEILAKAQKPKIIGASFEMPSDNSEENKTEQGENAELKEQVEALDEKAEEVGEQLENVDAGKLSPESARKILDNIQRVLGSFYMVVGSAAAGFAWEALERDNLDSVEKVVSAAVITLGVAAGVNGFHKLINGAKKFFGELSPDQKEEINS